jgi:hypothetical protein
MIHKYTKAKSPKIDGKWKFLLKLFIFL